MKKYRLTLSRHLANCWPAIVIILLITGGTIANESGFYEADIAEFFLIFFFLVAVPVLIIHINYYVVNSRDALFYDRFTQDYSLITHDRELKFNGNDIVKVVYNKSFALKRKDIQFLPWDSYNHAVIILKDGSEITLTSLLIGKEIKLQVEEEITEIKTNLFRLAPKHKLNGIEK